jgi:hypothetical protein
MRRRRRRDISDTRYAEVAAALQDQHPAWLVVWGEYSRRFLAYPWPLAPSGTWLASADPVELLRQMTEVERQYGWLPRGRTT